MTTPKRSSYPSRQLRGGPAPLASFEDLSDEISSPEEPALILSPDAETEEDTRTYSEGATPSTPRVLAQTPSTPLALDSCFSAVGTPDSFGHLDVFPGSSSRPTTPLPPPHQDSTVSRGSLFSPRSSPLFGRRSKSATPEPVDLGASNGSLDTAARSRPAPGTPSPRSARKLFTMSFFKPREDKTPSPTASPKSPHRTSPAPATSPKSPRRSSPFSGLFKGKEEADITPSPTKKRSHFPHFLRPKEERRPAPALAQEPASPAEHGKKTRVFGNLFTRSHHKDASEKAPASLSAALPRTPEDDEWITAAAAPSIHTSKLVSSPRDSPTIAESTEDTSWLPVSKPLPGDRLLSPVAPERQGDPGIFESTQDIVNSVADGRYDPPLRLGLSPSVDVVEDAVGSSVVSSAAQVEPAAAPPTTNLESPESEAELPEADPAVLKMALKGKTLEAETLLREDSFDGEEFPPPDVSDGGDKGQPEKETSRHRDKIAAFRVNPVDRPRSTAPVSFASLEAYINTVAQPGAVAEPHADKAKLRVVLPGEEFEHRDRQPKKPDYKSWFEFCEVGLQSPRSRRRQLSARSPSSFPERQEVTAPAADERRAESVDLGAMGDTEAWASFNNDTLAEECPCHCHELQQPRSDSSHCSSPDDFDAAELNATHLKDEEVEPLVLAEEQPEEHTAPTTDYATDLFNNHISQGEADAQSSFCTLPDCVFSGGEPVAPPCWANGVMDLLASLPPPKQPPPHVTSGDGRRQEVRTSFEHVGGQGDGM